MRSLRVVTLNTWKGDGAYAQRLIAMAAGLAALKPDMVALQEVFGSSRHDTAAHLARALDMTPTTLPLRPKPREVEGQTVDSTSGLAVLSRAPVRGRRSVPLTSDRRDGDRAALIVELEEDISIACVHLTHLSKADELRRRQWDEVQAALPLTGTCFAAGDFNTPVEMLNFAGRFRDSRQSCGAPAHSTLVGQPAAPCIDHVLFAGNGVRAVHWQTAFAAPDASRGVTPSDHLAVVADFAMG